MPSLLKRYELASKKEKGMILQKIGDATKMKYTTLRKYLLAEKFSHSEKTVISITFNEKIEELFPNN